MTRDDFQHNRPIFVKAPSLVMGGKTYQKGDVVPWLERNLPLDKITILFRQGSLHHNEEKEALMPKVGYGLEQMTVPQLHALVDSINKKVKEKTKDLKEYHSKECKKSTIHSKQCGLIRRWRIGYGELEAE